MGLLGAYDVLIRSIYAIEKNCYPKVKILCEPQLGKIGLYPTLSKNFRTDSVKLMMNLLTWSDGNHSLIKIAELCNCPIWKLYPILETLIKKVLSQFNSSKVKLYV